MTEMGFAELYISSQRQLYGVDLSVYPAISSSLLHVSFQPKSGHTLLEVEVRSLRLNIRRKFYMNARGNQNLGSMVF